MTDRVYNLNEIYGDSADTLLNKSLRRKVFFTVSTAHVLFFLGPLLWFTIWEKFCDKKPITMQVSLVNLNSDSSLSSEPPGMPDIPKEESNDSKKDDKKEALPEDESTVEEPTVEETPEEIPAKVVEPPVKNEPKVKVPMEKNKPVVKPPEKKVDTSKKWESKKPSEIIKSDKVVKKKKSTPQINANAFADRLKNIQKQCKITGTGGGGGTGLPGGIGTPGGTPGTMPAGYYDTLSIYLYDLWKQPGKAELRGLKPTVTVHISIDAAGNVKSAQIVKKSSIQVMDASVEELLNMLKTLPKPPQGAVEIDVSLEIENSQ